MKKTILCVSVVLFLGCFAFTERSIYSKYSVSSHKNNEQFDYSEYLAPKAVEAIYASQGVLCAIKMPNKRKANYGQALIVDVKKGIIISAAHIITQLNKEEFCYLFVYKGLQYKLDLMFCNLEKDIAILKIKETEKNKLFETGAKKVIFTDRVEPFKEYYALQYLVQIFNLKRIMGIYTTISLSAKIPFKARIVGIENLKKSRKIFYFDKTAKVAFSGSGFFNEKGEVVCMITSIIGGYTIGVPSYEIKMEINKFYKLENKKKEIKKEGEAR